jgi:hypothetical protein
MNRNGLCATATAAMLAGGVLAGAPAQALGGCAGRPSDRFAARKLETDAILGAGAGGECGYLVDQHPNGYID